MVLRLRVTIAKVQPTSPSFSVPFMDVAYIEFFARRAYKICTDCRIVDSNVSKSTVEACSQPLSPSASCNDVLRQSQRFPFPCHHDIPPCHRRTCLRVSNCQCRPRWHALRRWYVLSQHGVFSVVLTSANPQGLGLSQDLARAASLTPQATSSSLSLKNSSTLIRKCISLAVCEPQY